MPESEITDLVSETTNLLLNVNYKVAFLLFLVGLIIFSDIFVQLILNNVKNAVDGLSITTKGTTIQLSILSLSYLIIDLLVKYEFI